jgi:hypothetical protein
VLLGSTLTCSERPLPPAPPGWQRHGGAASSVRNSTSTASMLHPAAGRVPQRPAGRHKQMGRGTSSRAPQDSLKQLRGDQSALAKQARFLGPAKEPLFGDSCLEAATCLAGMNACGWVAICPFWQANCWVGTVSSQFSKPVNQNSVVPPPRVVRPWQLRNSNAVCLRTQPHRSSSSSRSSQPPADSPPRRHPQRRRRRLRTAAAGTVPARPTCWPPSMASRRTSRRPTRPR